MITCWLLLSGKPAATLFISWFGFTAVDSSCFLFLRPGLHHQSVLERWQHGGHLQTLQQVLWPAGEFAGASQVDSCGSWVKVLYVVVHLKCPTHATRVIILCGRSLNMAQQHQHRMMTTAVITTKMSESFLSVTSEKCGPQGQDQMSIPVSLPLSKVTDPAMSGLR